MEPISVDLMFAFGLGVLLLVAVAVQYHFDKVYTRAGRGLRWHAKTFVSRKEAPYHFWIIIAAQFVVGIVLTVVSGAEIYRRLV